MTQFSRRGFLGASALGAAAVGGVLGSRPVLAQAASPSGLTVKDGQFLLDEKPFRILSGSFHHFRTHPDDWRDRLTRMRALGLNTVDMYIPWNVHEPRRGETDFTGWRDVVGFIELTENVGLKAIVRPGPYICGEWDLGGLPPWLLKDKDQPLRRSDAVYERAVDDWFDILLPLLVDLQATRGGPIIAMQVENEYGSYDDDQEHLKHLKQSMRSHDIDSLLFCSNGVTKQALESGNLPDLLATINFEGDPTGPFAEFRKFRAEDPLFVTEYWSGWFDHWGEQHHTKDPDDTAANVEKMLEAGASINLYMAVGGTNFGWFAGANVNNGHYQPTITSYDYDAPISESGELTEKFHKIREVIGKYAPLPDGPLPATPRRMPAQSTGITGSVSLAASLDQLGGPVHRRTDPVHMEALDQAWGLIHYRTELPGHQGTAKLKITGLGDRALVYLDGKQIGTFDRSQPDATLDVTAGGTTSTLDVLVDPTGRVNFAAFDTNQLNDPKGITGKVLLDNKELHDWQIRSLPLDDLSELSFRKDAPAPDAGATFHQATLTVDEPADGFLAFPGWDKGMVWLNGFALGRYWHIGPQVTLYAPAPLWKKGRNELVVLEMGPPGTRIDLRAEPDLG